MKIKEGKGYFAAVEEGEKVLRALIEVGMVRDLASTSCSGSRWISLRIASWRPGSGPPKRFSKAFFFLRNSHFWGPSSETYGNRGNLAVRVRPILRKEKEGSGAGEGSNPGRRKVGGVDDKRLSFVGNCKDVGY